MRLVHRAGEKLFVDFSGRRSQLVRAPPARRSSSGCSSAERRRDLWHEPLPAAELAARLRTLPLFASVTVDALRTLLADNTDLVAGLFTTWPTSVIEAGAGPVQQTGASGEFARLASGGLSPVEKVLALQHEPLFSRVSADEMRQLAEIAQTIRLEDGAALFPESAQWCGRGAAVRHCPAEGT
jgi:hypothetical protein